MGTEKDCHFWRRRALGWLGDVGKKLKAIVQDPGAAARTVGQAVSSVMSGKTPPVTVIDAQWQAKPVNLGKVIAAPVALVGGVVAGEVTGIAQAFLPEGKVKDEITAHPFMTAGLLGGALIAPAAIFGAVGRIGAAAVEPHNSPANPPAFEQVAPPKPPRKKAAAKKPAKKKAKAKPKKKKPVRKKR